MTCEVCGGAAHVCQPLNTDAAVEVAEAHADAAVAEAEAVTERVVDSNDTQVEVARIQADAAVDIAEAQADAAVDIAEAQAAVDIAVSEAIMENLANPEPDGDEPEADDVELVGDDETDEVETADDEPTPVDVPPQIEDDEPGPTAGTRAVSAFRRRRMGR